VGDAVGPEGRVRRVDAAANPARELDPAVVLLVPEKIRVRLEAEGPTIFLFSLYLVSFIYLFIIGWVLVNYELIEPEAGLIRSLEDNFARRQWNYFN
jgi:hypothetical protein